MSLKSNRMKTVSIIEARSSEWELEVMISLAYKVLMIVPRRRQKMVQQTPIVE